MKKDSGILQWIDKNKFVSSAGKPFEWKTHSFLLDPMCDWSNRIVIRKSAQIGFSESFGVLKSIYAALHYGWNIIYTLPTDTFAEQFVTTKFDAILNHNPLLGKVVGGTTTIKNIDNRFIYFRGTHSTKGRDRMAETDKGISVSSDLNIHDEMDRSDQHTVEQYTSRLENSSFGGVWPFSNPTYPGVGCDGLYEESDQKVWMVKCGCGQYQYLDWIKVGEEGEEETCLIDPMGEKFVCRKCGKEITDTERVRGEWVAKFPDRKISGYWMSQLNYIRHHPVEFEKNGRDGLLRKERKRSKAFFYNFILGKAYRGTDVVVDRRAIVQNISMTDNSKRHVVMGVDQGIWKHFVIGNEEGIFEIGKTKDWKVIEKKFQEYKVECMVIDALPYPNEPKRLIKKYPGRVFICYYGKDQDSVENFKFLRKKDRGIVRVQRTKYFDVLVDKFSAHEKPLNLTQKELETFIEHWESLSRQDTVDALGIQRGEWVSSNGQDHFAHATLYEDVALEKIGHRESGVSTAVNEEEKRGGLVVVNNRVENYIKEFREKKKVDWRYT